MAGAEASGLPREGPESLASHMLFPWPTADHSILDTRIILTCSLPGPLDLLAPFPPALEGFQIFLVKSIFFIKLRPASHLCCHPQPTTGPPKMQMNQKSVPGQAPSPLSRTICHRSLWHPLQPQRKTYCQVLPCSGPEDS